MATKNVGYAAVCNTGRLHAPLSFKVCTEVLAAPVVRDKLVLNITDGLRGQYEGGPDKNEKFVYPNRSLYFATDPFALDMVCHRELVAKRKEMGIAVNEHPRFTEYLNYAEKLGLGIADPARIAPGEGVRAPVVARARLRLWPAPLLAGGDGPLLPPSGFLGSWNLEGKPRLFPGSELYGHIDGGAEIFFEFGFQEATVQRYRSPAGELVVECYRMSDPLGRTRDLPREVRQGDPRPWPLPKGTPRAATS